MKVSLISHTPDPERVCAASALTSYWYKGASETYEALTEKEIGDIIDKVIGYGHVSVIEHIKFTFSVEGVSRACTHQLVRHRVASYTQQSQRYVRIEDLNPVVPPTIGANDEANKVYLEEIERIKGTYSRLVQMGIPNEDARFILPNAATTNIVVTMNARELRHFFKFRCCERAQWEIRDVANRMLDSCKAVAPRIFKKAGPTCVCEGHCPEGDLSCGRIKVKK
ncbi:MAG TPA: FAD-dependent thymidylate synthase [Candidatus Methanofastidiosa archaeon]|nr:FAD-dependent thymidylate synthase [Candidatus Methanofastidiosa archaeon]HPR41081.1 FAD-dependent thymidylate synthase [Candidatus Methanofastidiosa archaeon]